MKRTKKSGRRKTQLYNRPTRFREQRSRWQIIRLMVGTVGLVAALLAIWEFYYASRPEVAPTYADRLDPLSAPFQIANRGSLFELYSVVPTCGLVSVNFVGGGYIANLNIAVGIQSANILPGHAAQYRCSLSTLGRPVKSADIVIWGTYQLSLPWKLLAHRFSFQSDQLNWQLAPDGTPYWTTGIPVE
jgi:hypothetical protein